MCSIRTTLLDTPVANLPQHVKRHDKSHDCKHTHCACDCPCKPSAQQNHKQFQACSSSSLQIVQPKTGMTMATLLLMQVIGAFVNLGHWLPLVVDSVAAPQASFTTRVNTLVILAAMLYAAGTSCSIRNSSMTFHAANASRPSSIQCVLFAAVACAWSLQSDCNSCMHE